MLYYDLHAHFLPGMDDGCKNCEEAFHVLVESQKQKITGIAATPHYYSEESIISFLRRREQSINQLMEYIKQKATPVPEICFGAEVAYRHGLAKDPDLPLLCYGNSHFLLLELPFSRWEKDILRDIQEICLVRGLIPVIAHLERYAHFQKKETLNHLFAMDVLIQMNAESYLSVLTHRKAKNLIKNRNVQVIGSDIHNSSTRSQNLGIAINKMKNDGLLDQVQDILEMNQEIFQSSLEWRVV